MNFWPSAQGDTPPPLRHADVLNGWSLVPNPIKYYVYQRLISLIWNITLNCKHEILFSDNYLYFLFFSILSLLFQVYVFHLPYTLCVQMGFKRTFQTNTKCKNINHVWSHFCNLLVVLKYHRRLWANIFGTDIYRSINIKKAKYTTLM